MANQLNYQEPVTSLINVRPYRPTTRDHTSSIAGETSYIFGSHPRDNIELWVYNSIGQVVTTTRISPTDARINLTTVQSNQGSNEFLNVNLEQVLTDLNLLPGRYSVVMNFFRDEVGSLNSKTLTIEEISLSRTEIRMSLKNASSANIAELYEFTTPSVPRLKAQALLDQLFSREVDSDKQTELRPDIIRSVIEQKMNGTQLRLDNSGATNNLDILIETVKDRIYIKALELIGEDTFNFQIQEVEFLNYIEQAIDFTLFNLDQLGSIDPRIELI